MAGPSSAASSSTSFARLLRSSKVISQYDPSIPSLVYTSHGGSAKRSDFGLKRALPRLRSPAIRVSHLDSPTTKLTDFDYASRELQFVKRWKEAGVGLGDGDPTATDVSHEERLRNVSERPGACTWDRESFEGVEELKQIAKTGKRKGERRMQEQRRAEMQSALEGQGEQSELQGSESAEGGVVPKEETIAFPPDYLNMSEKDFEQFLSKLRSLQPKYKAFLQDNQQQRHFNSDSSDASALYDIYTSSTRPEVIKNSTGLLIDQFISQELGVTSHDPRLDTLKSSPHRSMGLSYAPPNLYQSDVSTRTIPARRLAAPRAATAGGYGQGIDTSSMGLIDVLPKKEAGNTQPAIYKPDSEGNINTVYGKMSVRIEAAGVNPKFADKRDNADDFNYFATSGSSSSFSSSTYSKSLLDLDPISIRLYQAEQPGQGPRFRSFPAASAGSKSSDTPGVFRIGGRDWVSRNVEGAGAEKPIGQMSGRELFMGHENRDRYGQQKISSPNPDEFVRPDSVSRGRKKDAKASSGDPAVDNLLALLSKFNGEKIEAQRKPKSASAASVVRGGKFARFEK